MTLEERVQLLEARLRRQRRFTLVLAVLGAGALFTAATHEPQYDVIRAEAFHVVSGEKTVVTIGAVDGDGTIDLIDREGNKTLRARAARHGGAVMALDKQGGMRASMMTTKSGGSINVFGPGNKLVAHMGDSRNGSVIGIYDAESRVTATLSQSDTGGAMFIYDKKKKPMVGMAAMKDGGHIEVKNEFAATIASLRPNRMLGGLCEVGNKLGRSGAYMTAGSTRAHVAVRDARGKTAGKLEADPSQAAFVELSRNGKPLQRLTVEGLGVPESK